MRDRRLGRPWGCIKDGRTALPCTALEQETQPVKPWLRLPRKADGDLRSLAWAGV